jgi:CRP/FNR family transcriptional regulator, cyclic AMP receptor protein
MIKSDEPGPSGFAPMNEDDRVIMRRNPAGAGAANSQFGNTGFGNSGFGNSGGGFTNSNFGPSGIVPSTQAGMPQMIIGLLQSMQAANSADSIKLTLGIAQWQVLSTYLQPFTMEAGQSLIEQGSKDTTIYLIEAGNLNVHVSDGPASAHVAIVGAGTCIGEGAFFSRMPRAASVQAATRCKLWSINPMRFTELSNRYPAIALPLVMALGSVLSRRLGNKPKRGAVT